MKTIVATILTAVIGVSLLTGCSGGKTNTVKGILQAVDAAKNTVTVRTDTGEMASYRLDSNTQIKVGDRVVDPAYLEPGLSIAAQTKGKSAALIEINLAQLQGTVVTAGTDQLVLQPLDSPQQLTLKTRPFTLIRQSGVDSGMDGLVPGRIAEAYFCTATGTAYEVNQMPEGYIVEKAPEGLRIEGVVTRFRMDQINIAGIGGLDRGIWIDENTRIVFEDGSRATKDDIYYWDWVTVYYDQKTVVASLVKIRPESQLRDIGSLNQVDNRQ